LGLHPFFIDEHSDNDLAELELWLNRMVVSDDSRLVAIGEIGLDASCAQMEKQLMLFQAQLGFAQRFKLPVLIHARQANELLFKCLEGVDLVGGVIHAFSGSYELLMRFVRLGFKIGVGPVITWPSAFKTRDAISRAPLESLVLETDAPGMRVSGVSENRVGPFDVLLVFKALLSIRSESEELIRNSLWQESRKLFGI
jgi:TatD DNase family protein